MRLYASLILLISTFSSCTVYRSYASVEPEQMTSFNFSPREGELEVFFLDESKPTRDYLRIGLVKEQRTSRTPNLGGLMERMKKSALAMGADAVIVMGSGDAEIVYTDGYDDTYSVPKESMWGVAVKYVDEIRYQENILARMEVIPLAGSDDQIGGDIVFDMKGELAEKIPNMLTQNIYLHSLEYLLYSTNGWVFSEAHDPGYGYQPNLLRRQKTSLGIRTQLRVKIRNNGTPTELKIQRLDGRPIYTSMKIFSDKEGKIMRREWTQPDRAKMVVTRTYDIDGVCLAETYEVKRRGTKKFVPYVTVSYEYLSEEEFRMELEKEQIVKVSP
jgi:hypothetical protein